MSEEERKAYVAYRAAKAQETFEDALLLARNQSWNACANRLYYAAFYALSALLLQHEYPTQSHKGVKTLLGEHFVKTGKIEMEKGRFYAKLFDKRQAGDYAYLVDWTEEDVLPLIEPTKEFIEIIKKLIDGKEN